jgi:hypothetical protein
VKSGGMIGLGPFLSVTLAGAALLAAGAASATQGDPAPTSKANPTTDVSGVTVTAPQKPNPLIDPASQFVNSHLQTGISEQYARFRDAVCVRVVGLPPEFDAFVAKRIVELAKEVHAPVSRAANCTPNVNVIFTPDPKAQMADIVKRRDIVLGFRWSYLQLKKQATFNRTIQAWYVTRTRDTTGDSKLEINNPLYDPPTGRAGSRLENDMSAEIVHALIVADAHKLADAKIGSVADYVAVLALARWRGLDRCNALPTILNLMADGCESDEAPEGVTSVDLGLLTGLYASAARELGSQQRISIASHMRTELQKAEAEQH